MRYGITHLALGAQPFIEITPEHFEQIRDAKQNLVLTLEIEEKFDIFLENYVEFEETLSSAYDSSLSYRLLEELRNRLQHRSLPLSGISFPLRWEEAKAPPLLRHTSTHSQCQRSSGRP